MNFSHADLAFVVDPVDGTANFAAGLPLFGVMAAALRRGEVVAAAIHDPLGDDTALALRGEGAWMESAEGARRDLRVTAARPVARMAGTVSWRYLPAPLRPIALKQGQGSALDPLGPAAPDPHPGRVPRAPPLLGSQWEEGGRSPWSDFPRSPSAP